MAASKTTKKRKSKTASRQQDTGNRFQTEILILVMFAACLILLISAFGMGGIVGNAISSICFGIMGLCAYLFPIVLFGGVTFLIVNNKNRLAYKKIFAGIVFFIFLCGLLQHFNSICIWHSWGCSDHCSGIAGVYDHHYAEILFWIYE